MSPPGDRYGTADVCIHRAWNCGCLGKAKPPRM